MIDTFLLAKIEFFRRENKGLSHQQIADACKTKKEIVELYLNWYQRLIENFSADEQALILSCGDLITLARHPERYLSYEIKALIDNTEQDIDKIIKNRQK